MRPQVSLDPVNPQIVAYPHPFNARLEDAFNGTGGMCVLGQDYFNSTIHFRKVRVCIWCLWATIPEPA